MLVAQGPQPWETIVSPVTTPDGATIPGCEVDGAPTIKCLEAVFTNILSVSITLAGIALFIMLVIGSFRYLTSGGDPKAAEAARKTMSSAILGIVLIVASYLILRFISNFTGISLLKFEIPYFINP